jgi:hypothetical protein
MRGGPRTGAGRPRKLKDTVRNRMVRLSVTESEYEVLEMLGESWDVPTATASYGLLADAIAHIRKVRPPAIPENLLLAASEVLAKHQPKEPAP